MYLGIEQIYTSGNRSKIFGYGNIISKRNITSHIKSANSNDHYAILSRIKRENTANLTEVVGCPLLSSAVNCFSCAQQRVSLVYIPKRTRMSGSRHMHTLTSYLVALTSHKATELNILDFILCLLYISNK